jgi:hypothetical protein
MPPTNAADKRHTPTAFDEAIQQTEKAMAERAEKDAAAARLAAAAPAMDLLLRMALAGGAHFCADGIVMEDTSQWYSVNGSDWNATVERIGWSRCRAAAGLPEGDNDAQG